MDLVLEVVRDLTGTPLMLHMVMVMVDVVDLVVLSSVGERLNLN
jgi:hypothetical protein